MNALEFEQLFKSHPRDLEFIAKAVNETAIIAKTDLNGKILYANDLFIEISGYSREELIGNTHGIINSGYHDKDFFRQMWLTITQGKIWHGEICNKAKDGSLYWVDSIILPTYNEQDKVDGYLAIRRDITIQKLT
ncbi:MAG: PAS domain S-box protein, partial [Bdellovibrionales bacterium]|nr:PAS domain S-box protein [Bdellovibrionales bacterium]